MATPIGQALAGCAIAPEPFPAGVGHTSSLHAGRAELVRSPLLVDNLWAILPKVLVNFPLFVVALGVRLSRRWLGPAEKSGAHLE